MSTINDILEESGLDPDDVEVEALDDGESLDKVVKSGAEIAKEQRAKDFLSSIVEAEESMKPFKEHIKDIKKNYQDNMWLDSQEQKALIAALRLIQKKPYTLEQLQDALQTVQGVKITEE